MKKVTKMVVCIKDSSHEFPVVFEVDENKKIESHPTVQCPFCGTLTEVTIQGELKNDVVIRKLGFDKK